jgi:hypothetical protein
LSEFVEQHFSYDDDSSLLSWKRGQILDQGRIGEPNVK